MSKTLFPCCFLAIAMLLCSCNNDSEFAKTQSGMQWKLERFSDGDNQIHTGSLVQFEWTVLNDAEKELFRNRLFLKIDSNHAQGGIFEALLQLKEEEQGLFIIDNKDLEKEMIKELTSNDVEIALDGNLKHRIMVDKSYNLEEFLNKKKEFLGWVSKLKPVDFNSIENQVIENYISNNNLDMTSSETGLQYEVFKTNSAVTTSFGKHVKIRYHGGVLGKNKNHITTIQDFYIGQELQVIKAIEEVLLVMEQGDSATILAPSPLAFGEKGSSTGLIPGASPVIYGIRLLSCE